MTGTVFMWPRPSRPRVAEEPAGQESEDPYERRRRVMPVEQRGPGKWMCDDQAI